MDNSDEYSFFGERTQHLSERRQTAGQTCRTINTTISGVLTFLAKDVGFQDWGLMLFGLPLFVVGAPACPIWHKIIMQFRELIGWHYEQLRGMVETRPESHKVFSGEWQKLFRPHQVKEHSSFSRLEARVVGLFLRLCIVYSAGLAIATAFRLL